jgi:glycosyltransferase involved in cell wall biosynthesis
MAETLIVIPACNEGQRVGAVIASLRAQLPDADVLVVDDGSYDGTASAAAAAGARVARHPFNLGYGAALQTAYKYALRHGYRFCLQMDADGQHQPSEARKLLDLVWRGECDVAIGSRFLEGGGGYPVPPLRRVGIQVFSVLAQWLARERLTDVTSGFIACNRRVIRLFASELFPADFPDADVRMMLQKAGLRVRETPVVMKAGPPNKSMHSGIMTAWYVVKMLLSMLIVWSTRYPQPPDEESNP